MCSKKGDNAVFIKYDEQPLPSIEELAKKLGGEIITLTPPSSPNINPLELLYGSQEEELKQNKERK